MQKLSKENILLSTRDPQLSRRNCCFQLEIHNFLTQNLQLSTQKFKNLQIMIGAFWLRGSNFSCDSWWRRYQIQAIEVATLPCGVRESSRHSGVGCWCCPSGRQLWRPTSVARPRPVTVPVEGMAIQMDGNLANVTLVVHFVCYVVGLVSQYNTWSSS